MMKTTDMQQAVLEKLQQLPPDKQRQLFDFAEFLTAKSKSSGPRRSIKGLCADLGIKITAADITEARREMWGNFPRFHLTSMGYSRRIPNVGALFLIG